MKNFTRTLPALALIAGIAASSSALSKEPKHYSDDADGDEPYCREFTQTFSIGGEKEEGYGTACLQPDGSWQIVSQDDDQTNKESEINYVVKEEKVYVQPREVIFAPGHYWHRRPVTYIGYGYYPPYRNYGHRGYYAGNYGHGHRGHRGH